MLTAPKHLQTIKGNFLLVNWNQIGQKNMLVKVNGRTTLSQKEVLCLNTTLSLCKFKKGF